MKVKITADSTCDLSEKLIRENNITLFPLEVLKGEKSFRDGVDITPADIFSHVAAGGALCSTAAVNVDRYKEVFERFSAEYDAVIHVNIGSDFSSCYQNACIAAEGLPNVYIVDSRNLSTGQGHIVMEACERSKDATDISALCEELRELTSRVETSFLLSRLDYMVKGGRCSMVMALGANLLKLKPCIEVRDGKMQMVKKYRGTFDKCLAEYVKERLDARPELIRDRIFITYTPVSPAELSVVRDSVKKYGGFKRVYETTAGCTVSCHCGPGCLGVLFLRSK